MSKKGEFNTEDFKKWGINFLRFVALPTVIAFLSAYQLGFDIKYAYGVALGTGYTSVVDFLRKLQAGN